MYSVAWLTPAISTLTVTTIPNVRTEPLRREYLTEKTISDSTCGCFTTSAIQNGPCSSGEFQPRISARGVASVTGR